MKLMKQLVTKVVAQYRRKPWSMLLRTIIAVAGVVYFVVKPNFWTPDTLFIAGLIVFVVLGQARAFIMRFFPFLALLLVYDSFRSIADDLNNSVNYMPMVHFDRAVWFGLLPTDWFQSFMWNGRVQWYDFYFYFLYTLHFVAPVILGVIIWKKRDELYWPFVMSLLGLSFAAFITYVLFPAAPPWMASDYGYIEPIHRISSDIWAAMGVTNFSEVYSRLSPNAVAAVPSLHAAYPLLFSLFAVRLFGIKKVWWIYIYPFSVWLGIVYLGEHYIFDIVAGALYALVAYYVVFWVMAYAKRKNLQPHARVRAAYHRLRRQEAPEKS